MSINYSAASQQLQFAFWSGKRYKKKTAQHIPRLAFPSRDVDKGTSVKSESEGEEDSLPGVTSRASSGGTGGGGRRSEPGQDGGQDTGREEGGRRPTG